MGARVVTMTAVPLRTRSPFGLYAVTIFAGAFLLFQVQPLIAKFILPWFGGSPAVWTTCMLFFQVALLAGYAYAHVTLRRLGAKGQLVLHVALLALALATLPIVPSERWKPVTADDPTWRIFGLLAVSVGLPYLLVASTGPLLQGWLGRVSPGRSPYRLYALSNLASLGALLTYPFLIEPMLSRRTQAVVWSVGFGLFALLCAACAFTSRRREIEPLTAPASLTSPSIFTRLMWLLLPACGTLLLLATTNKICQEVAVIPFLWIVPLSLYLLTFVIAFDGPRWYRRSVMLWLLPLAVVGVTVIMFLGSGFAIAVQLGTYSAALFIACMICHGELARLKPPVERLTGYYLTLSAGGALGGLFVAVAAPLLFVTYFEYPLSLIITGVLAMVILFTDRTSRLHSGRPNWAWLGMITLAMVLGYFLIAAHAGEPGRVVAAARSFYGAISVVARDEDRSLAHNYLMRHGGITHGLQFANETRRREPTTYYGRTSGAGLLLEHFMPDAPRTIGAVGLGAGTLATYGRPADIFRFYEINPQVLDFAQRYFTFLKDSPAHVEHVLGDARLSLEREPDQHFDVLILDAFNGDAIPVHLLTKEAFDLYRRHLNAGGVIAVHITNQHLDLRPIVQAAADHLGLKTLLVLDEQGGVGNPQFTSAWMLLSADQAFLAALPIRPVTQTPAKIPPRLWTDDQSSLFPILR
ncbi:MAG: putative rane protein [Phycisphaerales bacterium]|nr:putative rane protein [Phycisphaerales bacterium]